MRKPRVPARPAAKPAAPPVTIIILNVPKELQPALIACCAYWKQSLERYTLAALLASLQCDVEVFSTDFKEIIRKWRNE